MNSGSSLGPDTWFIWPALAVLAGGIALAPLGLRVLARGVVFVDLAVAQAAAAAALALAVWVDHPGAWATHAAAAAGAVACAGAVAVLARLYPAHREALIGLLYVAGACVALLAARADPHGGERLAGLLAADLLWAGPEQVAVLATAAACVGLLARFTPVALGRDVVFYPVFALVASAAVPVLGLFGVFVLLIAPALWRRAGCSWAWAAGGTAAAAALGLASSWWLDAPSGPCVALAVAAWGVCSVGAVRQGNGV